MSDPYVIAQHLSKSFARKQVLNDVSFSVAAGDVIGVLGKNGAGKTTLLELMLGFTPATSGSVRVFGSDSFDMPAAAKARVGFVPQQDELIGQLTAKDQVRVIASFYSSWDDRLIERLTREWELDLAERVKNMSVGQRQKLSILLALGHRPDLLVLDEPVASLDPIARRRFLEQIVEVAADGQRSVVLSSHIVSDIERLANKIWILKEGRLFWQGDLDSLKESIVRVHVHDPRSLPVGFSVPNAICTRRTDQHMIIVACEWSSEIQSRLESQAGVGLRLEQLSLEEIFLELHR